MPLSAASPEATEKPVELPERQGQPWSEEEERKLYAAYGATFDLAAVAAEHQRTTGGIRSHLRKMGLADEDNKPITPRPDYTPTKAVLKRNTKAAVVAEIKASRNDKAETTKALSPELNDRFRDALQLMEETQDSLFITGKAGTGKSTLLKYFCRTTKKRVVILAPTGVAALNAGGQTIHNFFHFPIDITPQKVLHKKKPRNAKLLKKLEAVIIDEVSMVRADLLDCIETALRMHGPNPGTPFGGVQMIFIGDLYQLPPVVTSADREIFQSHYKTPYFFSAHAMQDFSLAAVELEKVYRQKDRDFLELLNRVRNNSVTAQDIDHLNSRLVTGAAATDEDFSITLTATNIRADEINSQHLADLKGKTYQSEAEVKGDFGREYYPTAPELYYKIGAQIMMLNNDKNGQWVNGTIGVITALAKDAEGKDFLTVRLHERNEMVDVYRHSWEVYKFSLAENQILSEPVGTFTQYPFRLAWAVTIHKSQGKTFERVTIDIGAGTFAAGQMYVALSRCTAFEGITLKTPVRAQHIRTDPRIIAFASVLKSSVANRALPDDDKLTLIRRAISDKHLLDIVYLKGNNEKTSRTVRPLTLGDEVHQGKNFLGMKAVCSLVKEERVFSVERILEIRKTSPSVLPKS